MDTTAGDIKRFSAIVSIESMERNEVKDCVENYNKLFEDNTTETIEKRKENYTKVVNAYYDLATSFYEMGWGQSWHFAPRHKWESFEASIVRHEQYLAHRIGLQKGMLALDVGCGIGGPARNIATFCDCRIVGLNNNAYQVERAKVLTRQRGLEHLCAFIKGDFMHIPAKDNTYDAIYVIEAACHAPNKTELFKELLRVLKPGKFLGSYEWVMTEQYDSTNERHNKAKLNIEHGNGLPHLETAKDVEDAVKKAGFQILEATDLVLDTTKNSPETPWHQPLSRTWEFSMNGLKRSKVGRWICNRAAATLETCRIAPAGTTAISSMLCQGAEGLVDGGRLGIFTPMFFVLAKKPE